jgi:hypothetical protein
MPKLPFKRKTTDDGSSINAYLPTHMIDYTSLPPIDEDTPMMKFRRLPVVARLGMVLLPLLLLAGAGWGVYQYLLPPAPVAAELPPPPTLSITSARVVSKNAITLDAQVTNVADGTPISAELLVDGDASAWLDPSSAAATVSGGQLDLRLMQADAWDDALSADSTYAVRLTVGDATSGLITEAEVVVPDKLRDAFFAPVVVETLPTATPEPTKAPEPTAEPTVVPTQGPPTLEVVVEATMLISPTLGSGIVAEAAPGATFEPLLRSADNAWFLVEQNNNVAWLYKDEIRIDNDARDQIPSVMPDADRVTAGPYTATVGNGGNIRYRPNVETGTVLGQLHARQTVTLTAQTPDAQWFKVVAPEAEGWVSVTLLDIDLDMMAQVPVTK